jgi:hypothetical protein
VGEEEGRESMKRGTKVRVKSSGRTGTVLADSKPGELVEIDYDDEAVADFIDPSDLEVIG